MKKIGMLLLLGIITVVVAKGVGARGVDYMCKPVAYRNINKPDKTIMFTMDEQNRRGLLKIRVDEGRDIRDDDGVVLKHTSGNVYKGEGMVSEFEDFEDKKVFSLTGVSAYPRINIYICYKSN